MPDIKVYKYPHSFFNWLFFVSVECLAVAYSIKNVIGQKTSTVHVIPFLVQHFWPQSFVKKSCYSVM